MQQDGIEYTLSAGDYLWLSPGILHGGIAVSQMPIEFYWLHFIPDEEGITVPSGFENIPICANVANPSSVIQLARQMLHCNETALYPEAVCDYIMYVLFAELVVQTTNVMPQNALAVKVYEYIRSYSHRIMTAGDVAEYLGYNIDYLSKLLKKHFGFTLQQGIANERLNRAKLFLQTSDYTVTQIAQELGYEDVNLFVKFFRYHQKMSPTAYRNSFTKMHTNHK